MKFVHIIPNWPCVCAMCGIPMRSLGPEPDMQTGRDIRAACGTLGCAQKGIVVVLKTAEIPEEEK